MPKYRRFLYIYIVQEQIYFVHISPVLVFWLTLTHKKFQIKEAVVWHIVCNSASEHSDSLSIALKCNLLNENTTRKTRMLQE